LDCSIFQEACFQPAPDQIDHARITDSLFDKPEHPFVIEAPEDTSAVLRWRAPSDTVGTPRGGECSVPYILAGGWLRAWARSIPRSSPSPPPRSDHPPQQFYIQLVEVEAAIKTLKDDLALRPIHHQLEHRIEAHIFVAFMAYCLSITLRARLKALAGGLTPRAVLDKMAAVQMLDVHFPTTDGRTLMLTRYTELQWSRRCSCNSSTSPCRRNPHPALQPQEISPSGPSAQYSGDLCLRRRDPSGFPVVLTVQLG
jgi:hypothetical protein